MNTFRNPVIPGFHPDPSVCRAGDFYYLVTSTFEFFPGVPVFRSRDLVSWELIGHCLTRESQLDLEDCPASRGIWAPTIRFHEGTFYMVTTTMNHGTLKKFLVTATDPAGEWSDPVWIDQHGIDPDLFFDEDGKVYVTSNGSGPTRHGIYTAELDVRTGALLSPNRLIWNGSGGAYTEAPHIYKINGLYYLIIAEGGTSIGHMQTVARSTSPWGPYEECPDNPILSHRERADHTVQATGHADLIQHVDGSWWAVFLAYRISTHYLHHLGRETFLAPVHWDDQGWPRIGNERGHIELIMKAPAGAAAQVPEKGFIDDFDAETLDLRWSYLRNPPSDAILTGAKARPGHLRLMGTPASLSETGRIAFVSIPQTEMAMTIRATLDFTPQSTLEEAGLTAIYFNERHCEVFVSGSEGNRSVSARLVLGAYTLSLGSSPCPEGNLPVELMIEADSTEYRLGWIAGGEFQILGKVPCTHLSTESCKMGFTGVMIGPYASGNGSPCLAPADFDQVTYLPFPEKITSPIIVHEDAS